MRQEQYPSSLLSMANMAIYIFTQNSDFEPIWFSYTSLQMADTMREKVWYKYIYYITDKCTTYKSELPFTLARQHVRVALSAEQSTALSQIIIKAWRELVYEVVHLSIKLRDEIDNPWHIFLKFNNYRWWYVIRIYSIYSLHCIILYFVEKIQLITRYWWKPTQTKVGFVF